MVITTLKKIIRVGNGAGILLSRPELQQSGLGIESPVAVRAGRGRIEITSVEARARALVSGPFAAAVEEFVRRYRRIFVELAREADR